MFENVTPGGTNLHATPATESTGSFPMLGFMSRAPPASPPRMPKSNARMRRSRSRSSIPEDVTFAIHHSQHEDYEVAAATLSSDPTPRPRGRQTHSNSLGEAPSSSSPLFSASTGSLPRSSSVAFPLSPSPPPHLSLGSEHGGDVESERGGEKRQIRVLIPPRTIPPGGGPGKEGWASPGASSSAPLFSPKSRFAPYSRGGRAKTLKRANTVDFTCKYSSPPRSASVANVPPTSSSSQPVRSLSARATPTAEFAQLSLDPAAPCSIPALKTPPVVTMNMFEDDEVQSLLAGSLDEGNALGGSSGRPNMIHTDRVPWDWSIKSSLRFTSTSPFDWADEISGEVAAAGMLAFARTELPSADAGEEDALANYAASLLFWRFPESDLPDDMLTLGTFASDKAPALRSKDEKALAAFFDGRREAWHEAMESVYNSYRRGTVPYFYISSSERTFLFRDGVAILSSSTAGFRALLRQHDVPFRSAVPSQGSSGLAPLIEDEDTTSALVVEGRTGVHALFNFILNIRRRRRPLSLPVVLSPGTFVNATMKTLRVTNNGIIKRNTADEQIERLYCLDIGGPILPSAVAALLTIFSISQSGAYEASLRSMPDTTCMNIAHPHQNDDSLLYNVVASYLRRDGDGYHVQTTIQ